MKTISNTWIFQANPQKYDIMNALADDKLEGIIHWAVRQHKQDISQGDRGIIWLSGKKAGIYAITEILTDPELLSESESEKKYWIDDTDEKGKITRVKMRIVINLRNSPITKETIRNILGLQEMSILKAPRGTNFEVKPNEWILIEKILHETNSL